MRGGPVAGLKRIVAKAGQNHSSQKEEVNHTGQLGNEQGVGKGEAVRGQEVLEMFIESAIRNGEPLPPPMTYAA